MTRPGKGTWPPSATEIELGTKCMRAWAARYCGKFWGKPELPAGAGDIGNALHDANDHYAKTGEVKPELHMGIREMFDEGLKWLPFPRTHWFTEEKRHARYGSLVLLNKMDWFGPAYALPNKLVPNVPNDMPVVMDYKTTSAPRSDWKLEHAQKITDIQTLMYTSAGMQMTGAPWAYVRHVYYKKTRAAYAMIGEQRNKAPLKPKVEAGDAVLHAGEVQAQMERLVLPVAERLYSIRSKGQDIHPLDMPPNFAACYDPFPCSYLSTCQANCSDATLRHQPAQSSAQGVPDMSFNLVNPPANGFAAPQQQQQQQQAPQQQQFAPQGFQAPVNQGAPAGFPAPAPAQQMPPQGFAAAVAGTAQAPQGFQAPAQSFAPPAQQQAQAPAQAPQTGVSNEQLGAAVRVILDYLSRR